MPITISTPPASTLAALDAAAAELRRHTALLTATPAAGRILNSAGPDRPAATRPALSVPVHVLGLDAIAGADTLDAVPQRAWAHFLRTADAEEDEFVVADVQADTDTFAALTEGPSVTAFGRQIVALQQSPDVPDRDLELVQLRVPALHLEAVWLRDRESPELDIVIPVSGTVGGAVQLGRQYRVGEFLAATATPAEAVLRQTAPMLGG